MESWVFSWRSSYIIVIIEWVEAHTIIMSIITVLLLHVPQEVILKEVVVVRILHSPTPI